MVVATVVVAKEVLRSGAVEQCGAACVTDECANREALARILPRGKGRSKIHAAKGFGPEKLRDLHSDVLIALTARSLDP